MKTNHISNVNTRKKILTICGSTKANSTNSLVLKMLEDFGANDYDFAQYPIEQLPFFNPDLDNENPPAAVTEFRHQIASADAIIICTPEYVFSLPGVLKNALEWCVSSASFSGKPVALIVASSLGEKSFESLQLVMKTIEAKFDENTTLLIQGAKSKIRERHVQDSLGELLKNLNSNIKAL